MFEILAHFFVLHLQEKDRTELVPLAKAIPEIKELHNDPERFLEKNDVVIGPNNRRYTAIYEGAFLGIIVGFVSVGVSALIFQAAVGWENVGVSMRIVGAVVGLFMLVVTVAVGAHRAPNWYAGGYIRMRRHSIEFEYRERSIFCPWALFRTEKPFVKEQEQQVCLSINSGARGLLKMDDAGEPISEGMAVNTSWFRFAREDVLVLRNLYAVEPTELAHLLHSLGARLG